MPRPVNHYIKDSARHRFQSRFGKRIDEYASIKRAAECVGAVSKQNYYRDLPNYFLFLDEDPDTVIVNRRKHIASDDPELENFYERKTKAYVESLKARNMAGRGINGLVGRIQGFFSNNSKRYSLDLGRLRIPKARKTVKYSPVNNEVRLMLSKADSRRDRLVCILAYHTGAAPIDLSELCRGELPREPFRYFQKSRSKTGEVWRGVTTPDVCEALNAYLAVLGEGEPSDLLFKSREGTLDNDGVSRVIFDLIRKAGFGDVAGFRPTSLRDAFEDALVDANINHKVKEALMAHTSDISFQYGSEAKMQQRLVEAMQATYPLICLNDANRVSGANMSEESLKIVNEIGENIAVWREIVDLVKNKKLVHVDDPELPNRLRKEGKLP